MKRSILFVFVLTLIGSSALAQGSPSGPPDSGSNPPTAGASVGGSAGVAAYGTSSGVRNIQDPNGTRAVATRFGTSSGVQQAPSSTAGAASQFGTSQGAVTP